jgi:hypothetical protein
VRENIAPLSGKENFCSRPHQSSIAFPIVIAEWPRNKRETIRVALDEYQGRQTIDCRVWWHDNDGVLRPGKSGLTLAVKHLPALADAVGKALARAIELRLVDDGGEP